MGAASKTRYVETLTSGSSWTVPANVSYVNVTLVGGGGGGGTGPNTYGGQRQDGPGGQIILTTVATTPGDTISLSIGAGGTAALNTGTDGGAGGNTTFTGATTALGGSGGKGTAVARNAATNGLSASNGGSTNHREESGAGGTGCIIIEYWV
jgi:hypothetical protein